MPNIKKVELTAKTITGMKTRTKNADEMNPDRQKIGPLWGEFCDVVLPTLNQDFSTYGVHYNYESDATGEFDVLAGVEGIEEVKGMNSVMIEAGKYLMFSAKGELHQAVMDGWTQAWAYFEDPSIDERRAFGTDFEVYKSADEAEIYIGVHYF